MSDDEFGLESWEKMFVRSWKASNEIMGTVSRSPWYPVKEEDDE